MGVLQSDLFSNANARALDDNRIDDATKAAIRAGRIDVTRRLEQAATSDPQHILQPQSGPHVRMIHRALIQLRQARPINPDASGLPQEECDRFNAMSRALRSVAISENELRETRYGPDTAAAVKAYKTARDIRRTPSAPVDNVVGIQTTKSLDSDMLIAAGKPPTPRPDPAKPPLDIFIRYNALANLAQEGMEDPATIELARARFNTPAYLATHQQMLAIVFFGGRGPRDPSDRVSRQVSLQRASNPTGKTIIVGASGGGFSVLNTAAILTKNGIGLSFVGIADGSFEFGDVQSVSPRTIRQPGSIRADRTLNVFQTFATDMLDKSSLPNDSGIAPGVEWFGAMADLTSNQQTVANNKVLTRLAAEAALFPFAHADKTLSIRKKLFSDPAHIEVVRFGEVAMGTIVDGLLVP